MSFFLYPADILLRTILKRINNKLTGPPLKETIDPTNVINDAVAIRNILSMKLAL